MAKKRSMPIKRDPFFTGAMKPLFDDTADEELMLQTDEDKASKFLSDYMDKGKLVERHKRYFELSAKDVGHILKDIKGFYKKLVLEGSWSEDKLKSVVETIMSEYLELNTVTIDRIGFRLEREKQGSTNTRRRRRS